MSAKFNHSTPIQIRFNDIDTFVHVNNAIVQEYFDLGRMGYFEAAFDQKIEWRKFSALIVSIKTDFVAPIFLKDKIVVQSRIESIGHKSMQVVQQIVDGNGNVKATCHSVMVGFQPKEQISLPISDEWRNKLSQFEGTAF